MKKALGLTHNICSIALLASLVGCANTAPIAEVSYVSQKVNLATEMKAIATNVKAFQQAQDTAQAKESLIQLRTAVERSQYVLPKSIDLSDTVKVAAYSQDLAAMLQIIDQTEKQLETSHLAEAKTVLLQLDAIKDRAHKAYR